MTLLPSPSSFAGLSCCLGYRHPRWQVPGYIRVRLHLLVQLVCHYAWYGVGQPLEEALEKILFLPVLGLFPGGSSRPIPARIGVVASISGSGSGSRAGPVTSPILRLVLLAGSVAVTLSGYLPFSLVKPLGVSKVLVLAVLFKALSASF